MVDIALPSAASEPPADAAEPQGPPQRRTAARLQAFFLHRFGRSGSVSEAAARTGVTPRTVQRWRNRNPAFARRYDAVLARRVEILEDLAMRRACGTDKRAVFHRGRQVGTVVRHNDVMLMRVLARFDRARVREGSWRGVDAEVARRLALEAERLERTFEARVQAEVKKQLSQMSRFTRQATAERAAR